MLDSGKISLDYSRQFRPLDPDKPHELNIDPIDFSDIDFTLNEQHNTSQSQKRKAHLKDPEQTVKKLCYMPTKNDQFTQFTKDATKHFVITCSMIKKSPCFGQDKNNNIIAQHSSVDFLIQRSSINTASFLGYGQEVLTGKSFKTLLKESELSKLDTLAKNVSEEVTINPFHALMKSKINDKEECVEMIVWPNVKKLSNNIFVDFYIQKLDDFQSRMIESNKNNNCGMDKIITLIDLEGFLVSLDLTNFKSNAQKNDCMTTSGNLSIYQNRGLLNDFGMLHQNENRKLKLTDYVHGNDLVHLQKHLNDVIEKGEMLSSAIYRLKINDRFAFVQSSSKIIKNESLEKINKLENKSSNNTYIHTIHSIIKEIDSEIEMKGKASTSLMKTLISRKPCMSTVTISHENNECSNNAIFPIRQKSQSFDVQPLTPIGTKFALTMLGLSKNQTSAKSIQSKSIKNLSSNESSNDASDKHSEVPYKDDLLELDCVEKNKLKLNLIKKKSIEDNVDVIRHPIDPNSSFKQLIKKEIIALEERKTNNNDVNKNQTKSKNNVKTKENCQISDTLEKQTKEKDNFLLKRLLLQENLVPTESNKSNESINKDDQLNNIKSNKTENENISKDDIILRALLNSNDLEPQVLEIESVFKLGQANNGLKKSIKNELAKKDLVKKNDQKKKNTSSSPFGSNIKTLLIKENIKLSDEIENNQIDILKSKFENYMEQSSSDFSMQNSSNLANNSSNQNIQLSKSCSNLALDNISEPNSIKSESSFQTNIKSNQLPTAYNDVSDNPQNRQKQLLNEDLQKQKRIEAITNLLKSDLIQSFNTSIAWNDQPKTDNQIETVGVNYPSFDQNLSTIEPEFVLNEISNATNYQNYIAKDNQYASNIQKSFYQSNSHSVNSEQPKESIQLPNQLTNTETNSTVLRKKLQERLYQKKSTAYVASSTNDSKNYQSSATSFAKNQSVNIAVVSPVVSSQHFGTNDIESKFAKKDTESKLPSQHMYRKNIDNEYKHSQQPTNTSYNYSLMPESYSYSAPANNQQTMTTTVTVTTQHYPQQINSPSYPPMLKQEKTHNYAPSYYTSAKIPSVLNYKESNVYAPVCQESANRLANEHYYEPSNQNGNYTTYKSDNTSPNIEINTKINVNFQMADTYAQKPQGNYSYQNSSPAILNRVNDYTSTYDNYKKMSLSYPSYEQTNFGDQSTSSANCQQNQYLRQSYESVCVSRAEPRLADLTYGNIYAKNELTYQEMTQSHFSNDLSSINTEMCDLQNFDEGILNENMHFFQNLLID